MCLFWIFTVSFCSFVELWVSTKSLSSELVANPWSSSIHHVECASLNDGYCLDASPSILQTHIWHNSVFWQHRESIQRPLLLYITIFHIFFMLHTAWVMTNVSCRQATGSYAIWTLTWILLTQICRLGSAILTNRFSASNYPMSTVLRSSLDLFHLNVRNFWNMES